MIEEAKIPPLEDASEPDDELVEMEENLHRAPLEWEDDEFERKRSHLDDVPLPQIRDQPFMEMALMTDGGGAYIWCIMAGSHMCGTSAGTAGERVEESW